jgi:hypothetical protein
VHKVSYKLKILFALWASSGKRFQFAVVLCVLFMKVMYTFEESVNI